MGRSELGVGYAKNCMLDYRNVGVLLSLDSSEYCVGLLTWSTLISFDLI